MFEIVKQLSFFSTVVLHCTMLFLCMQPSELLRFLCASFCPPHDVLHKIYDYPFMIHCVINLSFVQVVKSFFFLSFCLLHQRFQLLISKIPFPFENVDEWMTQKIRIAGFPVWSRLLCKRDCLETSLSSLSLTQLRSGNRHLHFSHVHQKNDLIQAIVIY